VTEEEILQATLDKDSLSIAVIGQADNFNRSVLLHHAVCLSRSYACYQAGRTQLEPTLPLLYMCPVHGSLLKLVQNLCHLPVSYMPIPMCGDVPRKCRLLSSFQSSLSEITVIALPDVGPGGSATNNVKIKSYVDPSKGMLQLAFGSNDWHMANRWKATSSL
jgi:hypothetical protein